MRSHLFQGLTIIIKIRNHFLDEGRVIIIIFSPSHMQFSSDGMFHLSVFVCKTPPFMIFFHIQYQPHIMGCWLVVKVLIKTSGSILFPYAGWMHTNIRSLKSFGKSTRVRHIIHHQQQQQPWSV